MNNVEKLLCISDKIGYNLYKENVGIIWKVSDGKVVSFHKGIMQWDNGETISTIVDEREIIFSEMFMEKLLKYMYENRFYSNFESKLLRNLNDPTQFIYEIVINNNY